jgi:peptide deformylase
MVVPRAGNLPACSHDQYPHVDILKNAMPDPLRIIHYPDPRLRVVSPPVTQFDASLADLVAELFRLMRQDQGVGLAAPQVGVNLRVFVINPTGKPEDDRAYINPVLSQADGEEDDEEGCLSLPKIRVNVWRSLRLHMRAQTPTGDFFEEQAEGFVARIWQHENDHLDGILLLDKMSMVDKLAYRKTIKELEAAYKK